MERHAFTCVCGAGRAGIKGGLEADAGAGGFREALQGGIVPFGGRGRGRSYVLRDRRA